MSAFALLAGEMRQPPGGLPRIPLPGQPFFFPEAPAGCYPEYDEGAVRRTDRPQAFREGYVMEAPGLLKTDRRAGAPPGGKGPRTGLFVTCLVDVFRPGAAISAQRLLERAGCRVVIPRHQTCCGQPAWNAGDRKGAARIAARVVGLFRDCDHVVVPSGSCAAMLRRHYPAALADTPWAGEVAAFSGKVFELAAFLVDVLGITTLDTRFSGSVTWHDGCSGLRELGIRDQPRRLLASLPGLTLKETPHSDHCCGFGGLFCVKYPDISERMVAARTAAIAASGADVLTSGDMGCLLNIVGRQQREGRRCRAWHIAEILAGDAPDRPPIGSPPARRQAGDGR